MKYIVSVDQSTQSTKALLFREDGALVASAALTHDQIYPREGMVEHDPNVLYENTVAVIRSVVEKAGCRAEDCSLALTNQRETVIVWNRHTGKPVCNAVVWQDLRGKEICDNLKKDGFSAFVKERTGLLIDPYFSASGVKWILDNVAGARAAAERGF